MIVLASIFDRCEFVRIFCRLNKNIYENLFDITKISTKICSTEQKLVVFFCLLNKKHYLCTK